MDEPQRNGPRPGRTISLLPRPAEATSIPVQCRGAKSFADDLGVSRGVVLSRAATILRSIETKPCDWKICPPQKGESFSGVAASEVCGG